jgi:catechol 2,3-dioxygenase-like lactoylglutathione lyase family enzyme
LGHRFRNGVEGLENFARVRTDLSVERYDCAMTLNFDCVFYYVSDLDRSIEFYRDVLGLSLQSQDRVARFLVDGVLLELVPASHRERLDGHGNARLCLRVDDVEKVCGELKVKGVQCAPIQDEGPGLLVNIRDLDGNEICLWQDAHAEQREEHEIWV